MQLVCTYSAKTGQDLGANSGSKGARMAKLWQTQNPHFLKKCKSGDKGKLFKNRLKSSPRLKGPKALLRKWHYSLICMQLKCKDWTKLGRKKKVQECPKGQNMASFERSPKTRVFQKNAKGGPRKAFKKWDKK